MAEEKKLPELLETFKMEFLDEINNLNPLVGYEVLLLEIEQAVDETPNDSILGNKIRALINQFKEKNV